MSSYEYLWVGETVALSLDEGVYDKYKRYCEEHSIILSRKVEKFMEEELKKGTGGN